MQIPVFLDESIHIDFAKSVMKDKADIIKEVHSPVPEADGYRLVWFHSSSKQEGDAQVSQGHITLAFKKGLRH